MVTTSENWMESEVRVSTDIGVLPLEIEFNRSLSLLIIRLANYSATTSLIYKSDV